MCPYLIRNTKDVRTGPMDQTNYGPAVRTSMRNTQIQILDVLYATTDGFEVPDEANGVDDEQDEY